jgi:hypothetical protein
MAQRVLRDKTERDEKRQRAMALWENTSKAASPAEVAALIHDLSHRSPITIRVPR